MHLIFPALSRWYYWHNWGHWFLVYEFISLVVSTERHHFCKACCSWTSSTDELFLEPNASATVYMFLNSLFFVFHYYISGLLGKVYPSTLDIKQNRRDLSVCNIFDVCDAPGNNLIHSYCCPNSNLVLGPVCM